MDYAGRPPKNHYTLILLFSTETHFHAFLETIKLFTNEAPAGTSGAGGRLQWDG